MADQQGGRFVLPRRHFGAEPVRSGGRFLQRLAPFRPPAVRQVIELVLRETFGQHFAVAADIAGKGEALPHLVHHLHRHGVARQHRLGGLQRPRIG